MGKSWSNLVQAYYCSETQKHLYSLSSICFFIDLDIPASVLLQFLIYNESQGEFHRGAGGARMAGAIL